jgi:hypothetical protein
MPITVKHLKVSTVPDAGDDTLVEPSDWNADHQLTGLGTMAEQNANAVAITGGTISGVTLPASNITGTLGVPNGGTGASTLTGYVKGTGTTAMTAAATIPNTDITGLGTASTKDAGAANGVATLDAGGKVPVSELPAAVLGALSYQGTWDASTNTPTLTSSVGTKGYYYVVSVAGNTNLNGITDWLVGDWAVFNGSIWQKVDNTETVTSVNGQTGAVVLTTTNVAEGTNLYYTDARARGAISAGTGISYNNTTGVVTNAAPDQTVSITGAGTSVVTGTYPNFTVTSNDAFVGTVTSVAATAGTGISVTGSPITTSGTLNITNTAPDQTVVLTAGTGISTSGTYPNFTITNTSPSLGGDVAGPASATDNAIARFDTTTGKLLQNSVVLVGDTGVVTGVTELTASTKVVSPHFDAQNSAGGSLRNASGTAQLQWGGGGGNNISVDVAININPANAQVAISPTGTGSVTINPATAGTINNMVIGGTTPLAITGTTITANTQFTGAGTGLTGTATSLSIGGNAATVTNGFYTTSSFNLGTTSIAVNRASASQSLTGISIDGNAGTVTNGVVTTGSYADPTWITSLAGSKITGTIDGGTF